MKLIVGLGNPTDEYENTRHNIGFKIIDRMVDYYVASNFKTFKNGLLSSKSLDSELILFLKPQTWMNTSGDCIQEVRNFYKIPTKDIVVIYDEMALPTGKVRMASKGSSAGHNGIKSIIKYFDDFTRLRIGIDYPEFKTESGIISHVLGNFDVNEISLINRAITDDMFDMIISNEKDKIMNKNAINLKTILMPNLPS